jgi:predicted unusual protein kinase regulating ubiquinone biosynthesis (AarF/ABC1/UbiB family)/cyclopropane fatty-acyl-phospholipid synthase-like methyltransferase
MSLPSKPSAAGARKIGKRPLQAPIALLALVPRAAYSLIRDRSALPAVATDALIALGPVAMKAGQVLSTRGDALPPALTDELARLRDRLPAESADAVGRALRGAFPQGVDAVLRDLSPQPIAAGTVAQVHEGHLTSGERVAVKILRPAVGERLARDFQLVSFVAGALERVSRSARTLNLRGLVTELQELLLSQTDLSQEARNYRRFARAFDGDDGVLIPYVYSELCSREVLITQFVDEVSPLEVDRVAAPRTVLAKRMDDLLDRMVYETGLCHADLHPGNFFWTSDGRIVLVDLGLVHVLSKEERQHLATFYSAVLDGFADFAASYVLRYLTSPSGRPGAGTPSAAAHQEVHRAVERHWGGGTGQMEFSRMFADLLGILGRHGLQLQHRYSKLFLTLVTVEGYELFLDPDFDPLENGRRKRVELAEYVSIPPKADELVLQGFATYSTARFGDGADPRQAWADRDCMVLDQLRTGEGTRFLDVGCGRGQLLAAAQSRGASVLGITVSSAEVQACEDRGVPVLLTSWEASDRHLLEGQDVFDAIAAVEMDVHMGTLHENREGLFDLRLRRFFEWADRHLAPGGRLFVQTLSVQESLLHDRAQSAEYERLTDALPFLGFSTLPQMIRCSDPHFVLEASLNQSEDLLPTFAFWRDNLNRQLPALRGLVRDEMIVFIRRELDALIGMTEDGQLSLYRLLMRKKRAG